MNEVRERRCQKIWRIPSLDRKSKEKRQPWGNMPHVVTIMSGVCSLKKEYAKIHKVCKWWVCPLINLNFPPLGKFNLTDFSGKHISEIKKRMLLYLPQQSCHPIFCLRKAFMLVQTCLLVVNVHFQKLSYF